MPLFKLRIETPDLAAGQIAAGVLETLDEPAALAVTLFELQLPRFVAEAYFAEAPSLDEVKARLATHDARLADATLHEVPDQNWVALSQAALPPVAAGRFVVHGGHDRARLRLRRLALEIEAGEAFGSGHNATTALCLQALDALARQRRPPLRRVLDLGCGSGVLAIAAARVAPAARVLATDNDPVAITVARQNARLNRVAGRVSVLQASGFDHPALRGPRCGKRRFDLVLANVLPGPLIALAPALRRALPGGGVAVLSGVLDHQAREVAAAYAAHGFRLKRRLQRDGWTALVVARARSRPRSRR